MSSQQFDHYNIVMGVPPGMTITVCGGGNGAHTTAAYLGSKPGLAVNVLTRQPLRWNKMLSLSTQGTSWEKKGTIYGYLNIVTDDPSKVIPQSDLILIASPSHTHPIILKKIAAYIKPKTILGSIYSQGGFDWAVQSSLGQTIIDNLDGYWGLLNIPWICNAPEYGCRVRLIGPKKLLRLASCPPEKARDFARMASLLFDIPCDTVPNFLSLTLTPSNQIIHPARYYGIFHDWDGKFSYTKEQVQWGLYSEMDKASADWLQKLDDELQLIKSGLTKLYPHLDLSAVLPIAERIKNQYGEDIKDSTDLVTIFRTNLGYSGCVTPTTTTQDGFIPNVNSRLFWEDVPFGLCILKSIAQMLKLPTPTIDFMIEWHQQFMGKVYLMPDKTLNPSILNETAAPESYGIHTLDQLVASSLSTPASRL